jgi:hypothetical protein
MLAMENFPEMGNSAAVVKDAIRNYVEDTDPFLHKGGPLELDRNDLDQSIAGIPQSAYWGLARTIEPHIRGIDTVIDTALVLQSAPPE